MVSVEFDNIDSVLVGVAIVTDVDCAPVGEDIFVVEDSWLVGFVSVVPVGPTVVKNVDCGSAGEDILVVDLSWLLTES